MGIYGLITGPGAPGPPVHPQQACGPLSEMKGTIMPSWLLLILVGVVLVVLGVATSIGHFLIWIGVVVLVVSLVLGLVGRGRRTV